MLIAPILRLSSGRAKSKGVTARWGLEEAGGKSALGGTRIAYEATSVERVGSVSQCPMQSRVGGIDEADESECARVSPHIKARADNCGFSGLEQNRDAASDGGDPA